MCTEKERTGSRVGEKRNVRTHTERERDTERDQSGHSMHRNARVQREALLLHTTEVQD